MSTLLRLHDKTTDIISKFIVRVPPLAGVNVRLTTSDIIASFDVFIFTFAPSAKIKKN